MPLKNESAETILEAIQETSNDEIKMGLLEDENLFFIDNCGVSVRLNREELFQYIEELTEIAEMMGE